MYSGPAKSMPVTAKSLDEFKRSDDNGSSIYCRRGFFIVLHTRHVYSNILLARRVLRTQNSLISCDNMIGTPKRCYRMWVCKMSSSVNRGAPSSNRGCRCSLVSSAHFRRPPKRTSSSSQNGLNSAILENFVRGKFCLINCSSAVNSSYWNSLILYIRAAEISVAVNLPTDFSFRRTLFRKWWMQSVEGTSFQYELNLVGSVRPAWVVNIRNCLGFLFSSGRDWLVWRTIFGQSSMGRASHYGKFHQIFRDFISSTRITRERW
jgi:hypothetical protein